MAGKIRLIRLRSAFLYWLYVSQLLLHPNVLAAPRRLEYTTASEISKNSKGDNQSLVVAWTTLRWTNQGATENLIWRSTSVKDDMSTADVLKFADHSEPKSETRHAAIGNASNTSMRKTTQTVDQHTDLSISITTNPMGSSSESIAINSMVMTTVQVASKYTPLLYNFARNETRISHLPVSEYRHALQQECVSNNLRTTQDSFLLDYHKCILPSPYSRDYLKFWMVSECPRDYVDTNTRSRCENVIAKPTLSFNDIAFFLPGYAPETGLHYKNGYCAACHNITRLNFWDMHLYKYITRTRGRILLQNEVMKTWDILVKSRRFKMDFQSDFAALLCSNDSVRVVSRCRWAIPNYTCSDSSRPAYMTTSLIPNVIFRNVDCFLCSLTGGLPIKKYVQCLGKEIETAKRLASLRVLMDFNNYFCKERQLYDRLKNTCVEEIVSRTKNVYHPNTDAANTRSISAANPTKTNCSTWAGLDDGNCTNYESAFDDIEPVQNISIEGRVISSLVHGLDWQAGGIITYTCLALSCLGLLVFIIIYGTTSTLNTFPSKLSLNLAWCLFIAQVLFMVGIGMTKNVIICRAISVILHYIWLAAIFWMNASGIHMFRMFKSVTSALAVSKDRKYNLAPYAIYSYLTPGLIVAISVTLNNTVFDEMAYGVHYCFIHNQELLAYSFALPVAWVVLTNIVFLVCSIWTMRKLCPSSQATEIGDRSYIFLYIKLTSVLGITWIFGFVATWTGLTALWYVFDIANGLQGMAVFATYVLKRSTYHAIRKRRCHRAESNSMSVPSHDRTTSGSIANTVA